jgi:hypothetical protein
LDGLTRPAGIAQDRRTHDVWFVEARPRVGRLQEVGFGDIDSDGVADQADNCVSTANGVQEDSDLDGFGNSCDPDRCPDYNFDGRVTISDLRLAAIRYRQPRPGGGMYSVFDMIQVIRYFFISCTRY